MIGVILSGLLRYERSLRREAHDTYVAAGLRCLDDAAIFTVLGDLGRPVRRLVHRLDGSPQTVQILGRDVELSVQDEAGRIDLNASGHEPLRKLFLAAGADLAEADAYADRIEDWRERGIGKRLNGAKRDDYNDAGHIYGPREAMLRSVGELRLVMGMTGALFDRVSPALTVYSEAPSVDMTVAPSPVLLALSNMSDADVADVIARRDAEVEPGSTATSPVVIGHSLKIVATASASGFIVRRVATVRLTGQTSRPFWFYEWE